MRIIATCMAANEADVVEAFVRHNGALLDALVVLDHGSIDSTFRILRSLGEEGFHLVVLRDNDRAFRQNTRQTWLARHYLESLDADFCFALDADELIKVPSRAALEQALGAIPADAAGAVAVQNYVGPAPIGDEGAESNPVRRLTQRMRVERKQAHKAVVPRFFARDPALHVSAGNHAVVRVGAEGVAAIPHLRLDGVFLAHFPVRSPRQIARKALLGWLSHRLALPPGSGESLASHWRGMFEGLAHGEIGVDEALARRAIALYVGPGADGVEREVTPGELTPDPMAADYELRYTEPGGLAPLAALATWADQLVSEIKSAQAGTAPPAAATRA
jgi:hypothetical protein